MDHGPTGVAALTLPAQPVVPVDDLPDEGVAAGLAKAPRGLERRHDTAMTLCAGVASKRMVTG